MTYTYKLMDSPVGQLKLVANGERLAAILWENDKPNRVRLGEWIEATDRPSDALTRALRTWRARPGAPLVCPAAKGTA